MKKPHIIFLTTANLSSNPRLRKEASLAVELGWQVSLFYARVGGNWDSLDDKMERSMEGVNFIRVSATKTTFWTWLLSSIVQKIAQKIVLFVNKSFYWNAVAENKRALLLLMALRKTAAPDLVIGHTLGALYPAYYFAKKQNVNWGFDIEDFHPGESGGVPVATIAIRTKLMQMLLPQANYFTYAAPLIGIYTQKLLAKTTAIPSNFLINNSFISTDFSEEMPPNNLKAKVNFVWFSLNIAKGRGLETILPSLDAHRTEITLTLIGNLYENFAMEYLDSRKDYIITEPLLPQKELHQILYQYDIGLALELSSSELNRDICLTNKIFTYAQAGLYILASETQGQKNFMANNSQLGICTDIKSENLTIEVAKILQNIETIRLARNTRFNYAKPFAYENESAQLVDIWTRLISPK